MDQQHDELNPSGTREPFFSIEPKRRRAFSIWFLFVLFGFVLGYSVFVLSGSDLRRIAPYDHGWWWSEIAWDWNVARLLLSHLGGDFFYIVLSAFVFTFVIHEGVPVSVDIVSYARVKIRKQIDKFNEYRKRMEKSRKYTQENQQIQRIAELESTVENLQAELEKQKDNSIDRFEIERMGRHMWLWHGKNKSGVTVVSSQVIPNKENCLDSLRQYVRQNNLRNILVIDERGLVVVYP